MSHQNSQETDEHYQPIATFILKTYAILSQPQNAQVIAWHQDGNCFTIKDIHKFTKQVLPHHFRHHKYESFIRQLNMYNFSKVKTVQGSCFANMNFQKGRDDLLRFIKRKAERKKRKHDNADEMDLQENKENETVKVENVEVREVKEKLEEQIQPSERQLGKSEFPITPIVLQNTRQVSFVELPKEGGEQNLSTLMEPSCKYLTNKEEFCWQNFKSFKSFKPSIRELNFDNEGDCIQSEPPKARSNKWKTSLLIFDPLNEN